MIDIQYLRDNPDVVKAMLTHRQTTVDVDALLRIDAERKALQLQVEELRAERNTLTADDRERGSALKNQLKEHEPKLAELGTQLQELLWEIPNLIHSAVPIGDSDADNRVIRTVGEVPVFSFTPRDHLELGILHDLIDTETAGKVSGSRFGYLKNEAALLEFALVQLALKTLIAEGFTPVIPPVLLKDEITQKLGYWQGGQHTEYYMVTDPEEHAEGLYLAGTAEHALVPYHQDSVLDVRTMPKRYVAFSTCFRREAGSYGKDTRGILRVHQFDKVEMVSLTHPSRSDDELMFFLDLEERLFQALEIPYQVIEMCSADLGAPAARKFDIEAWIPSQGCYREVTSTSTTTDYQARRLNIRYRDGEDKGFVHIQNGTAFAIGRTLIAILENNQEEDGTIRIPAVLQPYVGSALITRGLK